MEAILECVSDPGARVDRLDWGAIAAQLDEDGYATTPPVLTRAQCRHVAGFFCDERIRFRSTVNMASHNFGRGVYRYFDYPLPPEVRALRGAFYPGLAAIANDWSCRLRQDTQWPSSLPEFTAQCHAAGQCRPTPLMLSYGEGDYNCLHQDLYGTLYFPLQVVVLLSAPGDDFSGGELVLVEQRPRMQSRPMIVPIVQGAAAIVPVRERPRRGVRGYHRCQMRHGVSRINSGRRLTLGLIFHDAR